MGMLVDCKDMFLIHKIANYINRTIKEEGYGNRVKLVLQEDENSPLGVSFSMLDTETNLSKYLETDLLLSKVGG
jgi:hypothetical protein